MLKTFKHFCISIRVCSILPLDGDVRVGVGDVEDALGLDEELEAAEVDDGDRKGAAVDGDGSAEKDVGIGVNGDVGRIAVGAAVSTNI